MSSYDTLGTQLNECLFVEADVIPVLIYHPIAVTNVMEALDGEVSFGDNHRRQRGRHVRPTQAAAAAPGNDYLPLIAARSLNGD